MSRLDDLRKLDDALSRINRVSAGRVASRARSERAGVLLSRPSISILGTLHESGPVRQSSLARLTGLEAALVSREIKDLCDSGHVIRRADPTDRRAGLVELTPTGIEAWTRYRRAADAISAETFADWSSEDLRTLRVLLERAAGDVAGRTPQVERQRRAS